MKNIKMFTASIKLLLICFIIFSFIYPVLVGGIGQMWSDKSRGSVIEYNKEEIGSELIGQEFTEPIYFHSRPSSINYDARKSAGANLAPNNPQLTSRAEDSIKKLSQEKMVTEEIPSDLVTESGSALDPHLTPEAAYIQVDRISENTGISREKLKNMIEEDIENKFLGIFGHRRVNVLKLNIRINEVLNQ
ncbi:MAG: potassium-transporting ATPase subunit KdpC [Bacillota bacterium]